SGNGEASKHFPSAPPQPPQPPAFTFENFADALQEQIASKPETVAAQTPPLEEDEIVAEANNSSFIFPVSEPEAQQNVDALLAQTQLPAFEQLEVTPIFTLSKEEARILAPAEPEPQPMPLVETELRELPPTPVTPAIIAAQPASTPQLSALDAGSTEVITAALLKLAQQRKLARPKLLVIGREGRDISAFVKNTLGADSTLRKRASATFQHFEIGERKLLGQPCEVIGISMEQQFTKLLASTAQELSAYVMLVEAHRRQELTYLSYLLAMLKTNYRLPFGLAMLRSKDQKNLSKETMRDLLNLAEADYLHECNPENADEVAAFLSGLASEEHLAHFAEKK
ncbi:MAG: hypothetical protein AAB354_13215, partial [candidate division KSB1 bacterium]